MRVAVSGSGETQARLQVSESRPAEISCVAVTTSWRPRHPALQLGRQECGSTGSSRYSPSPNGSSGHLHRETLGGAGQ